jgi:cation transport protein ChaC
MLLKTAAFTHVPQLAGRIIEPEKSVFRITRAKYDEWDRAAREMGHGDNWRRTHEEREAIRARALAGRLGTDLWLFAYGSLMWDPAIHIDEIRTATLQGFHRRFCLRIHLGRGSIDKPGLMAGLDEGGECAGLAFRIPAHAADHETDILWMREMIADGYAPIFLPIDTPQGPLEALAFVVRKDSERYCNLDPEETARMIATGTGVLGSNLAYLDNMHEHLKLLGISDPAVADLHARAHRVAAGDT